MDRRPFLRALLAGTALAIWFSPAHSQADFDDDPIPGQYRFAPEAPDLLPLDPDRGESPHPQREWRTRANPGSWVEQHLRADKRGIRYREKFDWDGRSLDFRAAGPLVKDSVGVRFELRGLQLGRYPMRIRAIGAAERQQLEIEFRF